MIESEGFLRLTDVLRDAFREEEGRCFLVQRVSATAVGELIHS